MGLLDATTQTNTGDVQEGPSLLEQLGSALVEPLPDQEPGQSMQDVPRGAGLAQIPGNAFRNAMDIGQGLGVMGSLAGARILESLPTMDSSGFHLGQSPIRPGDSDSMINIAKQLVQQYKTNYYDPIVEGRPEDIYRYAATHPIDFAADVLPAAKATGISKVAGKLAEPVAQATRTVSGKLLEAAKRSETLSPFVEAAEVAQHKASILAAQRALMAPQIQEEYAAVNNAANAVPPAEMQRMQAIAEAHDPQLLLSGYSSFSPQARSYLEEVAKVNQRSEHNLLEMGAVTPEEMIKAKYRPSFRAVLGNVYGITGKDADELVDKQIDQLLKVSQDYLGSKGLTPLYQGRMTDKEARAVVREPLAVPKPFAEMARRARGQGVSSKLSQEYERIRSDRAGHFSKDSRLVTLARRTQNLQAYTLYKTLLERIKDAGRPLSALTPAERDAAIADGAEVFSPKSYFGRLFSETAGFDTSEAARAINATFPEDVILPRSLVRALNGVSKWKKGDLEKLLGGFASFTRRYVLGMNIIWPEKMFGQNMIMLGFTQFTGPWDAMVAFSSYAMARDPEVRKLIPPHILLQDQYIAEAGKTAAQAPGWIGRAQHMLEKGIDYNFARSQKYDHWMRMRAGIFYGLKVSEAIPELGGPIRGMVSTGEAINRLRFVNAHPELLRQVAQRVNTVLGDYSHLNAQNKAMLRSCLLWWMWYEHIVKFTAALPRTNPYKLALMEELTRIYPEMFQEDDMPEGLKKAGAVRLGDQVNEQGIPMYTLGGALNPWVTVTEIIEMFGQPVEGSESSTVLGATNPMFTLMAAQIFKMNPQTGHGFRDPALVGMGGDQYDPNDLQAGRLIKKMPAPEPVDYTLRTLFPAPMRLAERLYAKSTTGGEASQFTSVATMHPDPRTIYGTGGEPLAASSYFDIIKEAVLGQRAFPIDTESAKQMQELDPKRWQKAIRAMYNQVKVEE